LKIPPPLTEQADDIDRIWDGFLLIALGVAALVAVLLVIVLLRFRRGKHDTGIPRQVHEHLKLEIAYTVVPLLIVAGLFAVTFVSVEAIDEVDEDAELVVDVLGFQWQWQFAYPASDVSVIGTDAETPELVLPADTSVRFDLTSIDVIHSFWIPGFRFKRDMFPGQTTSFSVDVGSRTGEFPDSGVCAEFCGLDHHKMQFSVRVVTPDEFERWLQDQAAATEDGP
jgi:cytochrome c oxidase subunit 2